VDSHPGFMSKPFTFGELTKTVRETLDRARR
jgi:hypothetical protein